MQPLILEAEIQTEGLHNNNKKPNKNPKLWLMDCFPSRWAGGLGSEELMSVNSKTVAVLHVVVVGVRVVVGGGDVFLARPGAGAGQDGGCLVVVYE